MREIGAMWQIGVLTGKLCTFFWSKMGDRRRFANRPSLRKILPTDNLFFSNEFPKSYRYRYQSAILLELLKLTVTDADSPPPSVSLVCLPLAQCSEALLACHMFPDLSGRQVALRLVGLSMGKRLHMAEGPV